MSRSQRNVTILQATIHTADQAGNKRARPHSHVWIGTTTHTLTHHFDQVNRAHVGMQGLLDPSQHGNGHLLRNFRLGGGRPFKFGLLSRRCKSRVLGGAFIEWNGIYLVFADRNSRYISHDDEERLDLTMLGVREKLCHLRVSFPTQERIATGYCVSAFWGPRRRGAHCKVLTTEIELSWRLTECCSKVAQKKTHHVRGGTFCAYT